MSGQLMSGGGDGRPVARHVTFADDVGLVGQDDHRGGYTTLSEKMGEAACGAAAVDIEGHSSSLVPVPSYSFNLLPPPLLLLITHARFSRSQNMISLISSLHTSSSSPDVSSGTADAGVKEGGGGSVKGSFDVSSGSWGRGIGSSSWADDLLERTLR